MYVGGKVARKNTIRYRTYRSRKKHASRNYHCLPKCENDVASHEVDSIFSFLLILDFARLMDAIDNISHILNIVLKKLAF